MYVYTYMCMYIYTYIYIRIYIYLYIGMGLYGTMFADKAQFSVAMYLRLIGATTCQTLAAIAFRLSGQKLVFDRSLKGSSSIISN